MSSLERRSSGCYHVVFRLGDERFKKSLKIHMNHLERVLGKNLPVRELKLSDPQQFVRQRSGEAGHRNRRVSPTTIRKEFATLSAVWTWARIALLARAIDRIENPCVEIVPHFVVNKPAVHERIIEQGDEGTVWKKSDQPYEPARRVAHWIKRKRSIEVEAFVTGFKPGSPKRGHSNLVGALEFSARNGDGNTRPIAWVSNFTDAERLAMTQHTAHDQPTLNPVHLGRRAIIAGQDQSMKSRRIRHAKIKKWLVPQGR